VEETRLRGQRSIARKPEKPVGGRPSRLRGKGFHNVLGTAVKELGDGRQVDENGGVDPNLAKKINGFYFTGARPPFNWTVLFAPESELGERRMTPKNLNSSRAYTA